MSYRVVCAWLDSLDYKTEGPKEEDVLAEMQNTGYIMIRGTRPGDPRVMYVFMTNSPIYVSRQADFKKLFVHVKEPDARMFIVGESTFKKVFLAFINRIAGQREVRCVSRKIFVTDPRNRQDVPRQRICTPDEVNTLVRDNRIVVADLGSVNPDDSAVVWLDAKPTQVIESERLDGSLGYRLVWGLATADDEEIE
jgi:DNA-directed RNA polymerase subunit H (RpoH/RPB5)